MDTIESPTFGLSWDQEGRLDRIRLGGMTFPQPVSNRYIWHDQVSDSISASRSGDAQVTHTVHFTDGDVDVVWAGGSRVRVTLRARSDVRPVEGVGFSLCLPPGDVLTLGGAAFKWAEQPVGPYGAITSSSRDHGAAHHPWGQLRSQDV